jgi:Glycosyl transferases group 1
VPQHQQKNHPRVLYQRFARVSRAFNLIDDGMESGFALSGCEIRSWYDDHDEPELSELIDSFRPTHFVGCFQTPGRTSCRWMSSESVETLRQYRDTTGLRVALRCDPSNIQELFRGTPMDASRYLDGGVSSYYTAPTRPTDDEQFVIDASVINLLRTSLAPGVFDTAYRGYLEAGLSVLEEPFAADPQRDYLAQSPPLHDVVYVGGCWGFKWKNMQPYVKALKDAFGDRFAIYGDGWPEGLSHGSITDSQVRQVLCGSKVALSFHEPSQVMEFAFAPNERVHKLLAMGCCVVSDPNPILESYYTPGTHLMVAHSPQEMVSTVCSLCDNQEQAARMSGAGRNHTLERHTYTHRAQRLLEVLDIQLPASSIVTHKGEILSRCSA